MIFKINVNYDAVKYAIEHLNNDELMQYLDWLDKFDLLDVIKQMPLSDGIIKVVCEYLIHEASSPLGMFTCIEAWLRVKARH